MSKILKASRVILDDKKFRLAPEIIHHISQDMENENPLLINAQRLTSKHREHERHEKEGDDHAEDFDLRLEELRRDSEKIIEDAAREAKERIESAQSEYDKIVSDAYEKSKEIYEQSKEDGYKDGFSSGYSDGVDSCAQEYKQAKDFKDNAIRKYSNILNDIEPSIIALVLSSVEKILGYISENNQDYIEGLIRSAVSTATYTERVVVRVSPEDFGYVVGIEDRIITMFDKIDSLEIKQDPTLERGGCILETMSGTIDSSLSTQFNELRNNFEDLLRSERREYGE